MTMRDATPLRDQYRFGGEDDSTDEGTDTAQE
jgi:hypothetical protein